MVVGQQPAQGYPGLSPPWEDRREARRRLASEPPGGTPPAHSLDLGHLASRAVRMHISVVQTAPLERICFDSSKKFRQYPRSIEMSN